MLMIILIHMMSLNYSHFLWISLWKRPIFKV